MAPSLCIDLRDHERDQLLQIARHSIRSGLLEGRVLEIALHELPDALTSTLGVFVTLTQRNMLRGCIGSMQSSEPLAQSVAESAYGAAFRDPRFTPLAAHELDETHIEISILSPMEAVTAGSRNELLSIFQPEVDGMLLQDRHHRSTFLPKVWEQLPDPDAFLVAVRDVAKARGIATVASDAGLGRESLYKSLKPGAQPRFDTVRRLLAALGVRLDVTRLGSRS